MIRPVVYVMKYTTVSTNITVLFIIFTSVSARGTMNTKHISADNTFYNLGNKVPVSQGTPINF